MNDQFTDDDVIHSEDGEPYLTAAGIKKMCRLADELARETASVHAEGPARVLARMAPRIWMRHNGQSEPAPLAAPLRLQRLNVGDDVDATRDALNALASRVWARRGSAS